MQDTSPNEIQLSDEELIDSFFEFAGVSSALMERFTIPSDDSRYDKRGLLVASARKLDQQLRALRVLQKVDCLEEAVSLIRRMTEVIINGIYLQWAEDIETKRYLRFDNLEIAERLARDHHREGNRIAAEKADKAVSELAEQLGRKGTDLTWSSRTLTKRAKFLDENGPFAPWALVHDSISRLGNFPSHGTFLSLAHLLPIESEDELFPQRRKLFRSALNMLSSALRLFAHFAELITKDDVVSDA